MVATLRMLLAALAVEQDTKRRKLLKARFYALLDRWL